MSECSEVSDLDTQIIRKNTKLNTLINTHTGLSKEEYNRLVKFYSANKDKDTDRESESEPDIKRKIIIKLLVLIFIIVIGIPIIIGDLYYGYTNSSCVNDYPNTLNINMKSYLIVSAYYSIISCVILCIVYFYNKNEYKNLHLIIFLTAIESFMIIFLSVWSIIGSVIFWGTLYNGGKCNKNILTYLLITLTIKLLISGISLNILKNKISNI
jgi:Ni/Fe-hydrogenase subunit HybB-like protein